MTVLPSYKKPPVNEVVSGVAFENLPTLKIPYFGLLWEKFRKEYPTVEHAPPLGPEMSLQLDPATGLPIPRIWFINSTQNRLIQVQNDHFYFNWRQIKESDVYPRFPDIIKNFKENYMVFDKFVQELKLGVIKPTSCELTYINHIPKGQGWETIDDLSKVITDFCWKVGGKRFLPKPINVGWAIAFTLPQDKGRLIVKLSQATRRSDGHQLLILELSARGLGGDKSSNALWEWFTMAREWIVRGFADITTMDIQVTQWEREDVSTS